jgi:hypothetical protein
MAFVRAFVNGPDEALYCVLLDAHADTVEVVSPHGFSTEGEVDFAPSYYQELPAGDVGFMLRIAESTERPVGLLFEGASNRKNPRTPFARRRSMDLEGLTAFIQFAIEALASVGMETEQETMFPEITAASSPLRRRNGGWILDRA